MADDKRTEYFRNRRRVKKQIVFFLDREKAEKLDETLKSKGIGRTEWFRSKVEEEIGE